MKPIVAIRLGKLLIAIGFCLFLCFSYFNEHSPLDQQEGLLLGSAFYMLVFGLTGTLLLCWGWVKRVEEADSEEE